MREGGGGSAWRVRGLGRARDGPGTGPGRVRDGLDGARTCCEWTSSTRIIDERSQLNPMLTACITCIALKRL